MGLFGSKKVYVSSTVQNLAGDELKRPNYLKTTVIGSSLSDQESIADTLKRAYLGGPGIKLRSFFRWAVNNYEEIGMPEALIGHSGIINALSVASEIPVDLDETASVQTVEVGVADYSYWAEQYILENDKDSFNSEWSADIDDSTGLITITWDDLSISSFTPTDYVKDATYLYASYMINKDNVESPVEAGLLIDIGSDPFPSTVGWSVINEVTTSVGVLRSKLTLVDVVYSDSTPTEHSETSESIPDSYNDYEAEFERETYYGTTNSLPDQDQTEKLIEYMYFSQTAHLEEIETTNVLVEDLGGGVTKTTTTVVTEQVIVYDRTYQINTQEVAIRQWIGPKVFIYRFGSGNTVLDNLIEEQNEGSGVSEEFFPHIPIRLNNNFVSNSYYPELYTLSKKALKKSINGKIDNIIDELSELETLDDIDHSFVTFGVAVNVLENASRKYMYQFFKNLGNSQGTTITDFENWQTDMTAYQNSVNDWFLWKQAQEDILDPLYGDPEPAKENYPVLPYSKLTLVSNGSIDTKYKMEISWQSITETSGIGLAKPSAKKDELWFEYVGTVTTSDPLYFKNTYVDVKNKNIDHMRLYHQIDENNWTALDIIGAVHKNYIYKKKYVEITLKEGIDDSEESGFIVPLHYPTFKEMSLIDSTQMTTACAFIVFNSYVIKKTGLLGSLFFKIFLIVVIIIVIVFIPQLAPHLVKASITTGTALGLSGTAALIVGAAINAIAAMVLTDLIMKASIAVFGKKWGMIIGTIASIMAINGLSNVQIGNGFTINFGNILSAQNLTMLTNAIGNVFTKLVMFDAMDTIEATQKLLETYEDKMKSIREQYAKNLGYDNGVIDPLQFLDSSQLMFESSDSFLNRTLLTGSDISELSIDMLEEFCDLTLNLDLNIN